MLPVAWPSDVAKLSFFRVVITAAGLNTSARTTPGLEQRAFEAVCALARCEAVVLRQHEEGPKADVWLKAIARTAAMRTNIAHFGRAVMIDTLRGPRMQMPSFRQTSLTDSARSNISVAAPSTAEAEHLLMNRHGMMPEEDLCALFMDGVMFLSRNGCPWLHRSAVMEQCTADVAQHFDEVADALVSLRAIRVAPDGQIRLETAAV